MAITNDDVKFFESQRLTDGLRQASRQGKFRALTKVFHQMHLYTAPMINWQEYGEAWKAMVLLKFLMSG